MSYIKNVVEDKMYGLSDASGYDVCFLMDRWNDFCEEAAEDGEAADWDQFCGIAMEHDF